jgi:putative ABC transport system ATP-binding protein
MLSLDSIGKVYRKGESEVVALADVSLTVEEGEFLAIVGPSGSGKTTLLNILGCLDSPSSGTIVYDGTDLHKLDEAELSAYRRDRISFVFQSYNLIPVLTIRENVELPLVIESRATRRGAMRRGARQEAGKAASEDARLGDAEIKARALEMLAAVGLSGKEGRFPRELSGGQEQRVAIARALVKRPLVVLADEPTANLDSRTAGEILDLMRSINEKTKTTFIFSTHDRLVMERARRIVALHDGRVASDTTSAQADPASPYGTRASDSSHADSAKDASPVGTRASDSDKGGV